MTLTNVLKVGDIKGMTAYADSSPAPIADGNYNNSWKYTKTLSNADKFNIYFYGNQATNPIYYHDLNNFWAVITMGAYTTTGEIPFMVLYTLPNGLNDMSAWYKSKVSYSIDATKHKFFAGERVLIYAGTRRPKYHEGIRHIQLDVEGVVCFYSSVPLDETINALSVHSNSTNPAGFTCNLHNVGWSIHQAQTNILLN